MLSIMFHRWARAVAAGLIAGSMAACSRDAGKVVEAAMNRGDRLLAEKKFAEAAVEYRNAVQADGKFGPARLKLGETYANLGDLRNAYREFVRAADLLPDDPDAQVKAAGFLLAAEQYPEARARALRAIAKDPKNVNAQILLGNALAGMKDVDGALAELERAIGTEPTALGYMSIAQLQMTQSKSAEAEAAFKRAVATDPKSVLSRVSLAQFYWATGRAREAEVEFREAVAVEPRNPLSNRALATFLMASARVRDAEPFLKVVAEQDTTTDASQKFGLVDYYITTNRPDEALRLVEPLQGAPATAGRAKTRVAYIKYLKTRGEGHALIDAVIVQEPNNSEALVTKARFLANEKKLDEALKFATQASKSDPTNVQAWLVTGSIQSDRGAVDEAIAAYTEVARLNPSMMVAKQRLANLQLAKGDGANAVSNAQEAYRSTPGDLDVQLTLARSLLATQNVSSAEPIVKGLLQSNPTAAPVHAVAGQLAAAKNDWGAARRSFQRSLELDPKSIQAFGGLIAVYLSTSKEAELRGLLERHTAADAEQATLMLAARAYMNIKEFDRGRALLTRVITTNPSNPEPYEMLGRLAVAEGHLDDARRQFESVVSKNPTSAGAETMVGMVLELQGKRSEARPHYERALQLDKNSGLAANNLASLYADNNEQLDAALQLAQTAVRQMPDNASASDTLGWVYYKRDLANLAIGPFVRATEKEPTNPLFHYHLGLAYVKTGDKVRGRTALERAVKLQPNFSEADGAKRALAAL